MISAYRLAAESRMIRKRENVTDYFNQTPTLVQKLETITEKRYRKRGTRVFNFRKLPARVHSSRDDERRMTQVVQTRF